MPLLHRLKRRITFLRWGALCACVQPFPHIGGTPLEAVKDNYISLSVDLADERGALASAVVVAPGVAVTNAHVAQLSRTYSGETSSGRRFTAEVLEVSDRMDLALLKVPIDLPWRIASAPAAMGQTVWAMGTTSGKVPPVAQGRVANPDGWTCLNNIRLAVRPAANAICDGPIVHGIMYEADGGAGYSGGPVVNDAGELIGITQGTFTSVYDGAGRPLALRGTMLFAFRAEDVLKEVHRLLARSTGRTGVAEVR